MSAAFNYKHLYYFWVVAKEGGISRAAEKLDMAVQTVSAQVRALERALGHTLLKPQGRGLVLTDAGQLAMRQADLIFALGTQLPQLIQDTVRSPTVRLVVGICDALPKAVVHRLLRPALAVPNLHLVCHEGEWDDLLGDLALHRLDLVLSDRPHRVHPNITLYSHSLGSSSIGWYGTAAWSEAAQSNFPHSLGTIPLLLPTAHTAMRERLNTWFTQNAIQPRVVGEFEDGALLTTFGASGMGVFPASDWMHADLLARDGVQRLGLCDGVSEHFYAIGTEKKVQHPLVQRLLESAG